MSEAATQPGLDERLAGAPGEMLESVAKEYGVIDRVMYASDYVCYDYDLFSENPAQDFMKWMRFVREEINEICSRCGWPTLTEEEIDGILGNNAMRLYGITE